MSNAAEAVSQKSWNVLWTIEKFNDTPEAEIKGRKPDEILIVEDNLLLNDGITALLTLLIGGATYPAFTNANSYIWVGDSATAAAAAQTDLQAVTNKLEKGMEATFPSVSGQTVTFKSSFGSSEANWAWAEIGVSNGTPIDATEKMLNRKVASMGTKASGATWVVTVTITIS